MHVFLETERVVLRRFTETDVDNLFELDSDPDVMRFLSGGPPTPRDVIDHDILPGMLRYYERGDRYGYWAAIEKATGDFLGWFHFRPPEGANPDEAELGYRLRKPRRGRVGLPAAQDRLGQGVRNRGLARADLQGFH